jgi:hypothetical protein
LQAASAGISQADGIEIAPATLAGPAIMKTPARTGTDAIRGMQCDRVVRGRAWLKRSVPLVALLSSASAYSCTEAQQGTAPHARAGSSGSSGSQDGSANGSGGAIGAGGNPNDGSSGTAADGASGSSRGGVGGGAGTDSGGIGGSGGVSGSGGSVDGGGVGGTRDSGGAMPTFILGADISGVQEEVDRGTRYIDTDGQQKSLLELLKNHGFNFIRLRTFVNPMAPYGYAGMTSGCQRKAEAYGDKDHTIEFAREVKAAGMGLLLDFHYSDTWADPGNQIIPEAWRAATTLADLGSRLKAYTKDVVT